MKQYRVETEASYKDKEGNFFWIVASKWDSLEAAKEEVKYFQKHEKVCRIICYDGSNFIELTLE